MAVNCISAHTTPQRLDWKSCIRRVQQYTLDESHSTASALAQTRKWIEECTGCVQDEKTYREYLQDGTLLCELVQRVHPGLIRKINCVRSPFAWRDNLSFFLEACQQLGLKESQLFSLEDLQPSATSPYRSKSFATARGENERRLRNVANTIFWLGRRVKDLPDYSGPLLNSDLIEFEELQPPFKTTPTSEKARNDITTQVAQASTTNPAHSHPEAEPGQTVESPSIRVSRLESVESQTDKQSFAQVVLYIGGSSKRRQKESNNLDHLAKSEKNISGLVRLESPGSKPLSKQSGDSRGALVVESRENSAEGDSNPPVLLADLSTFLSDSRDSLRSPSFESITTPSEVSTVILREQSSSRCSGASYVSSEDCGGTSSIRSEFSETESSFNSPLTKRRHPSTDFVFTHESSPFSPTVSVVADTQEPTASLQSSPPQLSNPASLSVNSTGLLPLEFLHRGSDSQESDLIGPYISPREADTAFHFNLTGSQTSQSEDFSSEYNTSAFKRLSSDSLSESSYPLVPPPAGIAGKRLGLISEEPERETAAGESGNSANPSRTHSGRLTNTSLSSSQLNGTLNTPKPKASARTEASSEERSDKKNLSEVLSKSLQSSTDSISSVASSSSAIVVSYCERSRQVGEEVSDISHTPASLNYTSSFSSSSRGSNQDDSFDESSPEPEKRRNKYQLKLNSSNAANFNNNSGDPEGTGYLPTCPEEPRTPTSEDNMAGILTIFPSHGSSPGTTRATIPHHSLHVSSSSGSDSPLSQRNSQGRTLYIVPNSAAVHVNATASPSHSSSGEYAQGSGTEMRQEARGSRSQDSAYGERHYDELEIPVVLLPGEKLLGVNMAGGRGQGAYPRVQAIAGDTPASRSTLQCGDELMAVNGTPLYDTPHSKATGLLHQAAARGKLVLRVRRVRGDSPAHRSQQGVGHRVNHTPSPEESSIGPSIMTVVSDSEEQVFSLPHSADSALSSSLKVVGTDISRVQSDALPRSLYAAKLVVSGSSEAVDEEEESGREGDVPDFLSDINSTAVEVGSDCEKLSISDSHRSTCSEVGSRDGLNTGSAGAGSSTSLTATKAAPAGAGRAGDTSLVDSVLAVARRHTLSASETPESGSQTRSRGRGQRPASAPVKARSLSAGMSHTLPPNMSGAELRRLREKRSSVDEEREKRRANIQESARAALQYSAKKKKSGKTDSLPSHFRTSTLSKSLEPEDDCTSSPQHSQTSSSPVSSPSLPTAAQHTPTSGTPSLSSSHTHTPSHAPSTPLNLRHLSIDETREASFTQIDEIWREVEGGEEVGGESPSISHPASELSSSSGKESETNAVLALQASPAPSSSSSGSSPGDPKRQMREQPRAGPRPKALEEVDSPAPTSATLQPRSHSTPLRPMSATLPRGASAQGDSGERSLRAKSFNTKGIESLLSSLRTLNQRVGTKDEEEEFRLLEETLRSNTFKKAKEFHDTVHSLVVEDEEDHTPKAVVRRAVPVAQAARHHLHHHAEASEEVDELRELLREPHVQALLFCHDKVSTRDLHIPDSPRFHRAAQDPVDIVLSASVLNFNPTEHPRDSSAPLSRDVPTTRKEDATIVFLERTNRPLGCTIYKQEDAVFIGKLLKGCDAEQSEVLREGDELLEVNGVPVTGRSTDEIIRIMSAEPGTTLAFTIIPVHDDNIDLEYETKYVRAHFNYNGRLDEEIPCKALGLNFQKGDILEISNQDDPFWWQARKVFDDGAESLPGLIPARHLQQKREALVRSYPMSPATENRRKGIMSMFSKKKKKKIYYQQTPQSGAVTVGDEVVTYEDVVKVDPDSERKRPIVLIGAPGVGRRTLTRKLLNSYSIHFAAVVQHTTRPIRPGEVNGHNYYYTTKEEFEQEVQQERFLEYGELRGHYYGTSFIAIKRIIEEGRVPVLDVQPQALKVLRYSGLHPYVVFVASPRLERLHITRKMGSEKQKRRLGPSSQLDLDDPPVYTEADLNHLVEESYLIESQYGHYFDWIIVNDDFQVASDMLKEVARRVEDEPQWVPASWVLDQ